MNAQIKIANDTSFIQKYISIIAFISDISWHKRRLTTNLCTHSPKSTVPISPHADRTDSSATPSGSISSICILRNTSTASSGRLICAYAPITVVHDTTLLSGITSNSSRAQTRSPSFTYLAIVTFHATTPLSTMSANTLRAAATRLAIITFHATTSLSTMSANTLAVHLDEAGGDEGVGGCEACTEEQGVELRAEAPAEVGEARDGPEGDVGVEAAGSATAWVGGRGARRREARRSEERRRGWRWPQRWRRKAWACWR
ncbi:uncharacterized protein LOC133908253 [Phragmites australis]|uniref:uncharacterized protein LOC133908253 n=1 Tax=Phragmites australis TaxID=29695 RepID=UPI002D766102|nr:uncharacterized protein LOC133908253 [Phragmites australis]